MITLPQRNDPSLVIVPDWMAFYYWGKEAGYGEQYFDINDSRCLELQKTYLEETAQ